jgi:hypothetical protein
VHLNGYAFHPLLNNVFVPIEVVEELFKGYVSSEEYEHWAKQIRFAWEANSFDFSTIETILENSSTVIIVGYSLPLYNRAFDSLILNDEVLAGKNLIIQDINAKTIKNLTLTYVFSVKQKRTICFSTKIAKALLYLDKYFRNGQGEKHCVPSADSYYNKSLINQ